MSEQQQIKYIKHQNIDSEKWNDCIKNAPNQRFYALDFHLDRTAEIWDALIFGDYKFVMPMPLKKKWGITYLNQPLFSQQLGIFPTPPNEIAKQFYSILIEKFRYINIQLNAQNPSIQDCNGIDFIPRKNYLLSLNRNFSEINSGYSNNTKRNLVKAGKNNLNFVSGIRLEEYLEFKALNLPVKLKKKDLEKLKSIIAFGQFKGFGKIYGVYSNENELCAAVYFCRFKNRVIYMNAASNEQGKELGAMSFLVNNFIQENAGVDLILDFEGSMIPGVARFYKGFGATPETYFQLKYNRLPLPLKWLKR